MHHPRLGWLHRSWATHWASMGTSATQWHHHNTFLNKNRCFGESDYNFVCLCKHCQHCQHCHVFLKAELGVSKTWSTPKTASTQRFLTLLFCHFSHCCGQPSSGVGEHHELRSQPTMRTHRLVHKMWKLNLPALFNPGLSLHVVSAGSMSHFPSAVQMQAKG